MNRTKEITIQVWTDSTFVRCIGLWYPLEEISDDLETPPKEEVLPMEEGAPFIIVTSSMFDPRDETTGVAPVVIGQSAMPKEFLETTIRNMSYLFANETGMFQPSTKANAEIFLTKQTFSYTLVKEENMTVTPVQGSQSLKDLGNFINQFSLDEQEKIKVINNIEKPTTTDAKHIEEFIFTDRTDNQPIYITVTKLDDIYETEDPYIKMTQMPEDSTIALPEALKNTSEGDDIIKNAEGVIEADTAERETLKAYDDIKEDSITDETQNKIEPTREESLEKLLEIKNKQLMEAGIIPPTTPPNPLDGLPEPSTQSSEPLEEKPVYVDQDDLDYTAMTAPR
jgi:hypothetical protein